MNHIHILESSAARSSTTTAGYSARSDLSSLNLREPDDSQSKGTYSRGFLETNARDTLLKDEFREKRGVMASVTPSLHAGRTNTRLSLRIRRDSRDSAGGGRRFAVEKRRSCRPPSHRSAVPSVRREQENER